MPLSDLDPAERRLISKLGAHSLHAKYSGDEITAAARAAAPGGDSYWETAVDPDEKLEPAERARRAAHAKKGHFTWMALKSATARRKKNEGAET